MRQFIGFPDEFLDQEKVDGIYEELQMDINKSFSSSSPVESLQKLSKEWESRFEK